MSQADTSSGAGSWSWWASLGGLAGDTKPPHTTRRQRRYLASQGYVKQGGHGATAVWRGPGGDIVIGQKQAIKTVRRLKKMPPVVLAADTRPEPQGNQPWIPPDWTDTGVERGPTPDEWARQSGVPPGQYEEWWGWWDGTAESPYAPYDPGGAMPEDDIGAIISVPGNQAFVGVPGRVPTPANVPVRAPPGVFVPALPPWLVGILGVLWPSVISDLPWYDPRRPSGPKTRPRIPRMPRPTTLPREEPLPMPIPEPQPAPQPKTRPARTDQPWPAPDPYAVPVPQDNPWDNPKPQTRPRTRPRTLPKTPGPIPVPPTSPGLPDWLTWAVPLLLGSPTEPGVGRIRLPENVEAPEDAPLTAFQPEGVPYRTDTCECDAPAKKRRKKKCSNPVTSKRSFRRGGSKFRTITRRIECQA